MHRPTSRRTASFATLCALGLLSASSACSRSVDATYPGNHVVQYPWRACGMQCDRAFSELLATHMPTGKECEDLVAKAGGSGGTDDRVTAAALYDSAVLLILQGKTDEAAARFTRAEALDPDPDYKELEARSRESAQRYITAVPSAPAPAALPAAPATTAP